MTVVHEYIGPKSYQVSPCTSVRDVKQLLYEETNLPVQEQHLSHNGKMVSLVGTSEHTDVHGLRKQSSLGDLVLYLQDKWRELK